jgi:hypothetical protein
VEARPLAQVAVPGLEDLGDVPVLHELLDPAAVLLHDPVVDLLGRPHDLGDVHALAPRGVLDRGVVVGPAVVDQVLLDRAAEDDGLEVVHALALPAGPQPLGEGRLGGPVAAHPDGRRGPLEHVDVAGGLGQRWQALDARRPGADEAHDLVAQLRERLAGPATGVGVVPAGGVERVPGEVLHALDGRELEEVEDADGQHVPPRRDPVAPVGVDPPAGRGVVPLGARHPGVEQGVGREVEALGDGLEVLADLLAGGVAGGGDVVELLEHRQVDVGLDVAHHARVAVPVPGAADAPGLVDDADPLDAGLAQLGPGEHAGDAPADDDDVDLVGDGIARGDGGERVVAVAGEVLVARQVPDLGPAGHEALVALGQVLGPHDLRVVLRLPLPLGHHTSLTSSADVTVRTERLDAARGRRAQPLASG